MASRLGKERRNTLYSAANAGERGYRLAGRLEGTVRGILPAPHSEPDSYAIRAHKEAGASWVTEAACHLPKRTRRLMACWVVDNAYLVERRSWVAASSPTAAQGLPWRRTCEWNHSTQVEARSTSCVAATVLAGTSIGASSPVLGQDDPNARTVRVALDQAGKHIKLAYDTSDPGEAHRALVLLKRVET